MDLTWAQRLEKAKIEWGIVSKEGSSGKNILLNSLPYLQNVNEDPYLSGVVKIPLENGVKTIGKPTGSFKENYIDIRGLRIQKDHIKLENKGTKVKLIPGPSNAIIMVNGQRIKTTTALNHLDRMKLGSNNLYIYVGYPNERSPSDNLHEYDYDYFQSEMVDSTGMDKSFMRSISEEQGIDSDTVIAFQEYANIQSKVFEANAMSEEMNKEVVFEAQIKHLTGHDDLGRQRHKEVIIKTTSNYTKKVWVWSKEKFLNRKYMIQDMYMRWLDDESAEVDKNKDPFWDPVEDIYLGSCHVWLNNVAYCMDFEDYMDIRDYHGKEVAQLHAKIMPCDNKGRFYKDEAIVFDPSELDGRNLDFAVMLPQARDVLWVKEDNTRGTYLSFSFYDHPQTITTEVVSGSINPNFDFRKHFSIPQVGHDLLKYLQSHALVIELWGTQDPEEESTAYMHTKRRASMMSLTMSADMQLKELQIALARKEAESSRLRAERNSARKKLERYRVDQDSSGYRSSSASSDGSHTVVVTDPSPSPRRKSIMLRTGNPLQPNSSSLDAEMAKALKIFFKDIKVVQNKIVNMKTASNKALNSVKKTNSCRSIVELQHNALHDTDASLGQCVGTLKESMMAIIQRMKDDANKS